MTTKKEKLITAASATEKFFSNSTIPHQKKSPKKVFSFRADAEDVSKWRAFAKIKGLSVDDLGAQAMADYIESHPLSDAEAIVLNSIIQK